MNDEVKNNNEVKENVNQNEVTAQATTNEMKEMNMETTETMNNAEELTILKEKHSNHRKTEAERLAEKVLAKENRMKELAEMNDDQKKDELHKLEKHIRRINTGSRQIGFLYKQIRDEALYKQSEYSSSFTLYCRVTFKESRSNVYRQINYVEILEIIGESFKNYAEKTLRPLSCFKIASKNNHGKDDPEKFNTEAIKAVWTSVKNAAKKRPITERLVKEHIIIYQKTLLGGNEPGKVYVSSMNKCFDRSSFVDELIKEKRTAAGLLSVTKEMKEILTIDELVRIKAESDSLTEKEFEEYQKNAHAGDGYVLPLYPKVV